MYHSRVDGEVEPHELCEHWVLVSDHLGEVVAPVLLGVDGARALALLEQVVVDGGGHNGELGNQVHGVLEGRLKSKFNYFICLVAAKTVSLAMRSMESSNTG